MKNDIKEFYELLDTSRQELFDQIERHEILGASQHLEIMGSMFIDIVENGMAKDLNTPTIVNSINSLANHYQRTRGSASRAVHNGILTMIKGIDEKEIDSPEKLLNQIRNSVKEFNERNEHNLDKILKYAQSELIEFQNILLFDYSSTVERSIVRIAESTNEKINIYISESSAIDGGKPFLGLSRYNNIKIKFFPDAALYHMLKETDCCLMGAETFYPDGTGFNTIGSDMVGKLCADLNVPLYFITPLNKLDIRRMYGQRKEIVNVDYKEKYITPSVLTEDMDTIIPELIDVDPRHIYAYICERGVIPSNQMFQTSIEYDKEIRGY